MIDMCDPWSSPYSKSPEDEVKDELVNAGLLHVVVYPTTCRNEPGRMPRYHGSHEQMIRMTLKLSNEPPLLTARLLVPAIKPTVPEED